MALLHVAAEGGKLDVVEYLVGKCPNLNIKNQFEVSVLWDCTINDKTPFWKETQGPEIQGPRIFRDVLHLAVVTEMQLKPNTGHCKS